MTAKAGAGLRAMVTLLKRICQTPAPTFQEGARAELVAGLLADAGLAPRRDGAGNVIATVPGGRGPRVLFAAHLDTVFDAATDVTVREREGRLLAPGIGDNSASLAVMIHTAAGLAAGRFPAPQVTLAATVGEEGAGDLHGSRRLVAERRADTDLFVALDGHLGTVVSSGVASRRFEVVLRGRGGHSWGDYPAPSAVHALGEAVAELVRIRVPDQPRSSLNVGQVSGGTSVNAIAEEARFDLDVRSLEPDTLDALVDEALERVRQVAGRHEVAVAIETIGDRPAAPVDNRTLVAAAKSALRAVGVEPRLAASSTDANAAMAAGLPAIAFGVYRGGDAHRLAEWLKPASLVLGQRALLALLARLAA